MSRFQKLMLSIIGTILGHLLLVVIVVLLLSVSEMLKPTGATAATEPEEVTIVLADLMKNVELVPLPDPEKSNERQYLETFADQETDQAPKNAVFESDRNTQNVSERPPDPSSDLLVPTVAAELELPTMKFRDRQFIDGEFNEKSATSQPSLQSEATPQSKAGEPQPSAMTPAALRPAERIDAEPLPPSENQEFLPNPSDKEATPDKEESTPSPADKMPETPAESEKVMAANEPPEKPAERLVQPDTETIAPTDPQVAMRENVFEDDRLILDDSIFEGEIANQSQAASAVMATEEKGEPEVAEAPPRPERAVPRPPLPDPFLMATPQPKPEAKSGAMPESQASENIPNYDKPPSDKPAFNNETHRSMSKGSIGNTGDTASIATIETDTGKYKKKVEQAVQRAFLRYKARYPDLVNLGTVHVQFKVSSTGKTSKIKVIRNDAGVATAELVLKSVIDAEIPKMPQKVADYYSSTNLEINYRLIVF